MVKKKREEKIRKGTWLASKDGNEHEISAYPRVPNPIDMDLGLICIHKHEHEHGFKPNEIC